MYHNYFQNTPVSLSLCGFLGMLLFGSVALWGFGSWLFSDSAPSPDETTTYTVPIENSTIYQWRVCSGRSGIDCRDKYRLCITSRSLPAPDNPYCYISLEPIPSRLDNLPMGTPISMQLASDPKLDEGRRMLRFWELSVEGTVELSMERITGEHNRIRSWELQKTLFTMVITLACFFLYRYGRRKSRTTGVS